MEIQETEELWFWLCAQQGIYPDMISRLLREFKSIEAIYKADREELYGKGRLKPELASALAERRQKDGFRREYHNCREAGIHFISIAHPDYPARLKEIKGYPYGLFVKGSLPKKDMPAAAIVGGRRCTAYGKNAAQEFARALTGAGVQVVSGLAYGVDGFAQQAALDAGGTSFGVLGCGVDICYPRSHRGLYRELEKRGGLISELPPGSQPLAWHFPMRNRIISGLCDSVIVIEAKEKSGSLITADFALEQGRNIFALPGRMGDEFSAGSNRLIAQGAGILLGPAEFLETLGLKAGECPKSKKNNIGLETNENLVYSCVDLQPKSLQDITKEVMLAVPEAARALAALEIKGLIKEVSKNYYVRT